jgi:hypothetical protein
MSVFLLVDCLLRPRDRTARDVKPIFLMANAGANDQDGESSRQENANHKSNRTVMRRIEMGKHCVIHHSPPVDDPANDHYSSGPTCKNQEAGDARHEPYVLSFHRPDLSPVFAFV